MIETIKKKYYFQSVRPQQLGEKSKEIFGVNRQLAQFKTIVCKNGKTEFLTSIYTDDNGLPLLCYIVDRHRSY